LTRARRGIGLRGAALAASLGFLGGCDSGDAGEGGESGGGERVRTHRLRVTLEHAGTAHPVAAAGVAGRDGGTSDAPLAAGDIARFSTTIAPGERLFAAAMVRESNDWVVATPLGGLDPFAADGTPQTLSGTFELYDVGVEADEPLAAGSAQGAAGRDIGPPDPDPEVRQVEAPELAGWVTYRATTTATADGSWRVDVELELAARDVSGTPLTTSPWVWARHAADAPLLSEGAPLQDEALRVLATAADPSVWRASVVAAAGVTMGISPGVWAVARDGALVFGAMAGEPLGEPAAEVLAEDGNFAALRDAWARDPRVLEQGASLDNQTDYSSGLVPGARYRWEFEAGPGDRLFFAHMAVPSNDWLVASQPGGVALFDGDAPRAGDLSAEAGVWDVGTEVDQPTGAGRDDVKRQAAPNTGSADPDPLVRGVPALSGAGGLARVTIEAFPLD
jgi:hypothetical protein